MLKVDLHTHSTASPDGGITQEQYLDMLENGSLDYVAITDHNSISFAQDLQKIVSDKVIVGEEIMTTEGEIIGLFLEKRIKPNMSLQKTIAAIKEQGAIVYLPHPFETVRKGITKESLEDLAKEIDIVEVYNGRAVFQNKGPEATVWARLHQKPVAAASDAHGQKGVGSAYITIKETPTAANLVKQVQTAHLTTKRPPLHTLLYPKANRLKQRLRRHG
jgi:predicted metal-dependent phosphoesterase TrpH